MALVTLPFIIHEQVLHYLLGLEYSETEMNGTIQNPSEIINAEIDKITRLKSLDYYSNYVSLILNLLKNGIPKEDSNRTFL